ncbi:SLC13 family permease [Nocardioides sp.]|uniref:SLC13 family permease n=1 Tax=Nocardioides sp. TaxID=35761 RepID=UPI003D1026C1
MSDPAIAFTVLGAVIALFVWNRLPVEVVALGSAIALFATGILDLQQVFAGFGDPTVIFIASLFVVSEGLDAAGVPAWAGQRLIELAGTDRTRLLVFTMVMVALLTALISVNGAVAALLSMVVVVAIRLNHAPSQLLLPLAFAAHAGSMLALTGTPINVIASDALSDATGQTFGYFEFALVGVPLLIGTMLIAVFLGPRLLPNRTARTVPTDLSQHARTLIKQYQLDEGAFRLSVPPGSTPPTDLAGYPGLTIVGRQPDALVIRADPEVALRFAEEHGFAFLTEPVAEHVAGALMTPDMGVAEVVVSPRSELVGQHVFPGMVTPSGDLVILAVQRKGHDTGPSGSTLAAGDTLLVQGSWEALSRNVDHDPGVLAVDSLETVRRQAVPLGRKAKPAIAVLVGMVLMLALGVTAPAVVGILAAGAMILLRVLSVEQAYRGISWTTVIIVGAMLPLSVALQETGAADTMANGLVNVVGDAGPYALLLGLFVMTATLGQLISNTATALIVIPIGISAAAELDVSVQPVLMAVSVAAAAAFLTPVATPANMMVMGPGGYQFGDYWKFGLPMLLWFGVVSVLVVPIFWSF